MSWFRRVVPCLAVALIAVACQPEGAADRADTTPGVGAADVAATDTQADDTETIRRLSTEFAAAEAANDIDATLGYMWEDAVMQPPNAAQIQGHEAIRGLYETVTFESLDTGPLTVHVSGDLAVVWSPRMTYTAEIGGQTISDEAKFVAVWERRDGAWKVLENTWNTNLAPAGGP